jgi:Cd2+/Zn2+-exporting ATPase
MDRHTLELPVMLPSGPECSRCIVRLQSELGRIKGVEGAAVNNARSSITVTYDPNVVTLSRIEREARQIGANIEARIAHQTLELRDLDCPDCASTIEKAVGQVPGVLWAGANFAAGQIHIEFERERANLKQIRRVIEGHGARVCPLSPLPEDARREPERKASAWRRVFIEHRKAIVTLLTALLTALATMSDWTRGDGTAIRLYAAAIVLGGWSTARSAWLALRARKADMNVLMTLAVLGAAAIGEWFEAATVVALYNIGNLLQAGAMERTRRSLRALMELSPRTARVLRGSGEYDVPVEQVRLYETVLVRPGERIAMDGEVAAGESAVNEAPITGESMPADKKAGDRVYAGTLNGPGALEVRVTCVYRETVLAKIIHRVEEAQAQRAPAQQFIDRFAARYTPMVVVLAFVVAILPPSALWLWHAVHGSAALTWTWSDWFVRALSLLIIACPCALVISTPVAIVTAIGTASRAGALVKGGAYLEELSRLRAILYDKTGTLTEGRFRVEDVLPLNTASCNDILRIAAAMEQRSEHPLAEAFVAAARKQGNSRLPAVQEFEALPGRGVRGVVEGSAYLLGNPGLLHSHRIELNGAREHLERVEALGKTAVMLANAQQPLGIIVLSDTPRADLAQTVRELESLGIEYQAMLTGDNPQVARSVAEAVGLHEYKASLLPEQKLTLVKEFQRRFGVVAMVGDGVNDAPALAAANIGIVMGAAGSDTAMETADVALMADDLTRLPVLIRLSRRTKAIIFQNVAFSLLTKAILLGAAVFVGIPLWLAVMGDVGVSLLVTLNALRLMERQAA